MAFEAAPSMSQILSKQVARPDFSDVNSLVKSAMEQMDLVPTFRGLTQQWIEQEKEAQRAKEAERQFALDALFKEGQLNNQVDQIAAQREGNALSLFGNLHKDATSVETAGMTSEASKYAARLGVVKELVGALFKGSGNSSSSGSGNGKTPTSNTGAPFDINTAVGSESITRDYASLQNDPGRAAQLLLEHVAKLRDLESKGLISNNQLENAVKLVTDIKNTFVPSLGTKSTGPSDDNKRIINLWAKMAKATDIPDDSRPLTEFQQYKVSKLKYDQFTKVLYDVLKNPHVSQEKKNQVAALIAGHSASEAYRKGLKSNGIIDTGVGIAGTYGDWAAGLTALLLSLKSGAGKLPIYTAGSYLGGKAVDEALIGDFLARAMFNNRSLSKDLMSFLDSYVYNSAGFTTDEKGQLVQMPPYMDQLIADIFAQNDSLDPAKK